MAQGSVQQWVGRRWRNRAVVSGNAVRLLCDGVDAFPRMLAAIAAARESIALESYIFAGDRLGRRFVDALTRAARRGVQVRVIVDGLGSLGLRTSFFAPLLALGGELLVYHAPALWPSLWRLWRRDHRKLLVCDTEVAFVGGLNIADSYAPPAWGGEGWHDAHAEVRGPAAHALAKIFAKTWVGQRKSPWALGPPPPPAGDVTIYVLESRLARRLSIRRAYIAAINDARETVRLCNAYCIPDHGILRALRRATERGVSVQLMLAGTTDVKAVQYASRALYARMLRWGVQIHEWGGPVLHAKNAVIDGRWSCIGSYNMDRRSLLHNLEINIACNDVSFAQAMKSQFETDLARCRRINPMRWHRRPILQKLLEQVFYKLRYLL